MIGDLVLKLSVSLGIVVMFIGAGLIYKNITRRSWLNPRINTRYLWFIKELKFRSERLKQRHKPNSKETAVKATIAGLMAVGLSRDWAEFAQFFLLIFVITIVAVHLYKKIGGDISKNKKLKDIAVLFEAIELYMKAGYPMVQALRLSRILTPNITKEIDMCLDHWATSPKLALEKFKEELNLEQGEMLVSILIHMEMAGTKNLSGILAREAYNIERLRRLRTETRVSLRPLYLMVYRFIPLVSALGIIAGPLLYRTYRVLLDAGLLWF